jgi:hypothetical protein
MVMAGGGCLQHKNNKKNKNIIDKGEKYGSNT